MVTISAQIAQCIRVSVFSPLWTLPCQNPQRSFISKDGSILLLEADGRVLAPVESNSVDAILTDHPWLDTKANLGGNRQFVDYGCFEYTLDDFLEKYRVLKPGRFFV